MGPLCDPGSEDAPRGRKGARLCRGLCRRVVHRFAQGATALRAEGCGIARSGDEFYNTPSAVTSTWSIIIILTLVHPFATSWPSSPRESMSLDSQVAIAPLRIQFAGVTPVPLPPSRGRKTLRAFLLCNQCCRTECVSPLPLEGRSPAEGFCAELLFAHSLHIERTP